ncbi:MAG: zinc ABC transporter substrate-binding protein [Alphaproteobacteria bacterium]|nr:zinc ABC transporter substrate-binding protein [Alphaproteobacteria bacterium]
MILSTLRIVLSFAFTVIFASLVLANDKLTVFVSIAPQKYFVQQIAKDLVDVKVMVLPGADPHMYEPKPKQMVAMSKAKLYFTIGIEFEKANLGKIVSINPQIKVVNTDRGIKKISMAAYHHHDEEGEHHKEVEPPEEDDHRHEQGDSARENDHHNHGGLDPHIWLSPPLVKIQAYTIMKALQEIDPSHRALYEGNFQRFVSRIDKLSTELKAIFADKQGLQFMVFHPSWGYFAMAYGLRQVPVQIEGKNPKPAQLKELIEHARGKKIKMIFVQPQFSAKSAQLVAKEIGGEVAFVDPLAENWSANLREVANKFKAALK